MPYAIAYAPDAEATLLDRMPAAVAEAIVSKLEELGADPSRGRSIDYPVRTLLYGMTVEHDGLRWGVTARYQISADETTIIVTSFGLTLERLK